jgi:hypothetical protein
LAFTGLAKVVELFRSPPFEASVIKVTDLAAMQQDKGFTPI